MISEASSESVLECRSFNFTEGDKMLPGEGEKTFFFFFDVENFKMSSQEDK